MPDQLAHYRFARKVLGAAPDVHARVNAESPAFRAGTFGPDPLFNDPSAFRRAEGFEIHRGSGKAAMERLRHIMEEELPWAAEYAAGFFCHYALDRLCHPYILEMAKEGVARHVAIESAYDRELMLREGIRLPVRLGLDRSVLQTAARVYTRVSAGWLGADIEAFWQIRRFAAFSGGTPLTALPGKIRRDWDGLIPHKVPSPQLQACFEHLDALIESGVEEAVGQLELFFEAVDQKKPLDDWLCADFSGFQTKRH